jgi:putative transposase
MFMFRLTKGLRLRDRGGRFWTLDRIHFTKRLQFEADDGEIISLTYTEFHRRWLEAEWIVDRSGPALTMPEFFKVAARPITAYPQAEQDHATFRFSVIEALLDGPRCPGQRLQNHCEKFRDPKTGKIPNARSVRRWVARYRSRNDLTDLIDRRCDRRRTRNPAVAAVIEDAIESVFLTGDRKNRSAVYAEVENLIENGNRGVTDDTKKLLVPSRTTVYRRLRELDSGLTDRHRLGADEANNRNRTGLSARPAKFNLERVEIDHCRLDVLLVDDRTGLPLGRPWLTIAIDCNSRMVVGYHLSFDAPSANSVLQCAKMGVLPKDLVLRKFPTVTAPWPVHGVWHVLVADNGMDLHANRVRAALHELGTHVLYCPARMAWYKGIVERFFRTLNDGLIHTLPGTTFSNPKQRAGYKSAEKSCLGFQAFERILITWILNEYHHRNHRGLRCAPIDRWKACEDISPLILPASPAEVEILAAAHKTKRVWHYGVEFDSLTYNSPALQDLRRRLDTWTDRHKKALKLEIRYHEHTVEYIEVLDPETKQYLRVPANDQKYAVGVDRLMHAVIKRKLKDEFPEKWTSADRRRIRHEILGVVEQSAATTKEFRRLTKRQAEKGRRDKSGTDGTAGVAAKTRDRPPRPDYMTASHSQSELPTL